MDNLEKDKQLLEKKNQRHATKLMEVLYTNMFPMPGEKKRRGRGIDMRSKSIAKFPRQGVF